MFSISVKANPTERARSLPGDELISESIGSLTHAITIGRPRGEVWPWLAQMGAGSRAGWYSYDVLDNGGRRSAERIVPELQTIPTGTLFPALPGVTEGFHLLQCEPGRHLVLGWLPAPGSPPTVTWSFMLEETNTGTTRLIVRVRATPGYRFHGLPWWLAKRIVPLVHFIMQRKQLIGIARRAEHAASSGPKRPEEKGEVYGPSIKPSIDRPMALERPGNGRGFLRRVRGGHMVSLRESETHRER